MNMLFGETHTASARRDVEPLMVDFAAEIDSIIALHRHVVTSTERDFTAAYERHLSEHDPAYESYDGADAVWDAEQELGFTPWSTEQHIGLMSLTRGVALAEIVMARLAASRFAHPQHTVFPNGQTWTRAWEAAFYKTCLNVRFDPASGGFGALRSLRDLYSHGYGVPVRAAEHQKLARILHQHFDTSDPTSEEAALGYTGPASFFGPYAEFDHENGIRDTVMLGLPEANLTPVIVYRALLRVRDHVIAAETAVSGGLRTDAASSKFATLVTSWWERQGGPKDASPA
jgi:hypothetical protein